MLIRDSWSTDVLRLEKETAVENGVEPRGIKVIMSMRTTLFNRDNRNLGTLRVRQVRVGEWDWEGYNGCFRPLTQ